MRINVCLKLFRTRSKNPFRKKLFPEGELSLFSHVTGQFLFYQQKPV